jgi:hypothetical protein
MSLLPEIENIQVKFTTYDDIEKICASNLGNIAYIKLHTPEIDRSWKKLNWGTSEVHDV